MTKICSYFSQVSAYGALYLQTLTEIASIPDLENPWRLLELDAVTAQIRLLASNCCMSQ